MIKSYIYQYRDYLQKRYGVVLHRVPLDAGFSCPHRLRDGSGGCIFCPSDGARAVQLGNAKSLAEQINKGVLFAKRRYNATAFMAYLQAFTATFRSKKELIQLVETITAEQNFHAIAFGTRPDCLPPHVIGWLAELQQKSSFDIWIELGVQTSHNTTLELINRGHTWQKSKDAVIQLAEAGLPIAAHLIIDLPGENKKDFQKTAERLCVLPINALKLHNLHIIEGTELASRWKREPFPLMDEYEYIDTLLQLLPIIPDTIPLIRLTTDTPAHQLLAPKWSMCKGKFHKALVRQMRAQGVRQGSALRSTETTKPAPPSDISAVTTDDGSLTFYNTRFKEHYHTLAGARSEAEKKYIIPGQLTSRLNNGPVKLLDICFGLGYNSLVACETAIKNDKELHIDALELDRTVVGEAAQVLTGASPLFNWPNVLQTLLEKGYWNFKNVSITLFWGDARHLIKKLDTFYDLLWLDAFSTQRNSELWTVDFFTQLYPLLKHDAALLTYSAAIPVRAGFIEAGFSIGETEAFGRPRGGTIAVRPKSKQLLPKSIPNRDKQLITTLRGIPYRDPHGTRTSKEILRVREAEVVEKKRRNQT